MQAFLNHPLNTPRYRVGHILNEVKNNIEGNHNNRWSSYNDRAQKALRANSAIELFPYVAGLIAVGFFDKYKKLVNVLIENLRGDVPLLSCFQKFSATNLKTANIPQTFDDDMLDSIVTALHRPTL